MAVKSLLADAVTDLLLPLQRPLVIGGADGQASPTVIMVTGVNGAGKTTSIGKLTRYLAEADQKVLLAAADTFRAAAREQLAVWAGRNQVEIVSQEGGDPAAETFDAVTAFMGGTLFTGRTCSALTAGVMALGLAVGRIEDSRIRVLRMIATMAAGRDALGDDMNAFNRAMNLGNGLARWFEDGFGSTRCRSLTGCDFASNDGVRDYIDHGRVAECLTITRRVSSRVAEMLAPDGRAEETG